ncbi:MAG: hypothetical protein WB014_14960 [Methanosarcina sp.]
MKRSWNKPEMIVLVRRKSDEVILASCKEYGGGADTREGACLGYVSGPAETFCVPYCA